MGVNLEDFSKLLGTIDPKALVTIASDLRNGQTCIIDTEPRSGSFNLVYLLTFEDETKWAARIPQHGTRDHFAEGQSETMRAELELLQTIHKETSIPVPEVVYFDTSFDNALGAPFSLATWLEGLPAYRAWFDPTGPTSLDQRRLRILESLADSAVQLGRWSAPTIGLPILRRNGEKSIVESVTKIRTRDAAKEMDLIMDGVKEDPVCFYEDGPFGSTAEYLRSILNSSEFKIPIPNIKGHRKLLELMVDALGLCETRSPPKSFVLSHPDFAAQNVLVHEDGTLSGILDWDGIHTVPMQLGYAKCPFWIMRDWLPDEYAFWSRNSNHSKNEDLPAELARYRKHYYRLVQQRLHSEGSGDMNFINSHVFQALVLACKDQHVFHSIVTKIARTCLTGSEFHLDYDILYPSPNEDDDSELENHEDHGRKDSDDMDVKEDEKGSEEDQEKEANKEESGEESHEGQDSGSNKSDTSSDTRTSRISITSTTTVDDLSTAEPLSHELCPSSTKTETEKVEPNSYARALPPCISRELDGSQQERVSQIQAFSSSLREKGEDHLASPTTLLTRQSHEVLTNDNAAEDIAVSDKLNSSQISSPKLGETETGSFRDNTADRTSVQDDHALQETTFVPGGIRGVDVKESAEIAEDSLLYHTAIILVAMIWLWAVFGVFVFMVLVAVLRASEVIQLIQTKFPLAHCVMHDCQQAWGAFTASVGSLADSSAAKPRQDCLASAVRLCSTAGQDCRLLDGMPETLIELEVPQDSLQEKSVHGGPIEAEGKSINHDDDDADDDQAVGDVLHAKNAA